ncbi:MAG: hypothetical protein H7Y19_12680 [Luteimonas sp.]|nr:hypothetical protein [Luteimonas sp.]
MEEAIRTCVAGRTPGPVLRKLLWSHLGLGLLMLVSPHARATDAGPSVQDFIHATWTARDGVLPDTWAIAQTGDGWLWFAGPNGLTRFDGLSFEKVEVVTPGSKLSNSIRTLYATHSGSLLIGHQAGGVSILEGGKLTHFDTEQTRRADGVVTFAQGPDGVIWAAATNGLMRFDGKLWQAIGSEWNIPVGRASAALVDAHGTLWVTTENEVWRLPRNGARFERLVTVCQEPAEVIQSPDGRSWNVCTNGAHLLPGQGDPILRDPSVNWRMSYAALFDQHGNYWSAWPFTGAVRSPEPSVRNVSSLGNVKTMLQDRDGSIWVGDQNAVIHRLRRPPIARIPTSPRDAFGGTPWTSFAADRSGNIWMALSGSGRGTTDLDGVWKLSSGRIQRVQAGLIRSATAVARDRDDRIWIGGRQGLWRLEGGERFVRAIDLPDIALGQYVLAITFDCAQGVWASISGTGLQRYDGAKWHRNGNVEELPAAAPRGQTCDSAGRLWLGYGDGTLARVGDGRATIFSGLQGLQVGPISAISAARSVLVAGERGLAVLVDGKFHTLRAGIPAFEGVTGIIESRNGDVWLHGGAGLAHIKAGEIERAVSSSTFEVPVELFDGSDGFPMPAFTPVGLQFTSPVEADDGRIWFAGAGGIASIHPSQARLQTTPGPLVIRSLTASGHSFDLVPGMTLPKGTRNLEIAYTALNYSHPDRMRFRYRLDGLDTAWVIAGTRRQALYTNLGPGSYSFRVNVTLENGQWSDSSSSLVFMIPPTFVQSRVFLALCVAAGLGLTFLLYRVRVRQLTARERLRMEERMAERVRIARELHDTLLQGTQSLILTVQTAAGAIPEKDPIRQKLDLALDRADAVMAEGRDRIQDLRVTADAHTDLLASIADVGSVLASGTRTTFNVQVEGAPRELTHAVRSEAYRIGREALLNAFRHAEARAIEVQVIYGDQDFRLRVRDDGQGIGSAALEAGAKPGHWGLRGMRERAQTIGASIDVWTRPQAGTEIELIVPAKAAYGPLSPHRPWWRAWRSKSARR